MFVSESAVSTAPARLATSPCLVSKHYRQVAVGQLIERGDERMLQPGVFVQVPLADVGSAVVAEGTVRRFQRSAASY